MSFDPVFARRMTADISTVKCVKCVRVVCSVFRNVHKFKVESTAAGDDVAALGTAVSVLDNKLSPKAAPLRFVRE